VATAATKARSRSPTPLAQGGLHAFGVPTADVTTVAAAFASTERLPGPPDFPGNSVLRLSSAALPVQSFGLLLSGGGSAQQPAAQVSTETAVALAAPPRTLFLDAESCGPAIGDLRIAQDDRKLSDSFEECASLRTSLLGSPELLAGLMV
jgi:hypothetical protein